MSNLADLVKDLTGSDAKGIAVAGDVLGALADVSGAIGLVEMGLSLLDSASQQDDQLQLLLNQIQAGFNQLQSQGAASDKLARMRDIDTGINPAIAVFQQLPAMLQSATPLTSEYKLSQIQICLAALSFFTNFDDKWQSVAAGFPYYADSWSGSLAPTAGTDGLVFNYTYTLPQFLRAIYIFLAAVSTLDPTSLPDYKTPLSDALARLTNVHQTIIVSGIVGTRLPTAANAASWTQVDPTTQQITAYPYGAVEIYSGASLVRSYKDDYFDYDGLDMPTWGTSGNSFLKLLHFRIVRQMKALYIQIGMPAVAQVIGQLRGLTGQPPITTAPYTQWPFAQVIATLGLTLPPHTISLAGEPTEMESVLKTFLAATPPYIAFKVFGSDPVIDPKTHAKVPITAHPLPLPAGDLYTYLTGVSLVPVLKATIN